MSLESPVERTTAAAQRLRLRRFAMAVATYGVLLLMAPLLARVGDGDPGAVPWLPIFGLAVLINLGFYGLFRSNLNLRFRDPSLTQAQILVSAVWGMLPLYALPAARPLVLMLFVPPFSFGMLRLSRRQYFASVAVVLALYAAVLAVEYQLGRPGFSSALELLGFATFALLLAWIAVFGGFVSDLRRELVRQKRAIEQARDELGLEIAARARVAAENERLIAELRSSLAQVNRLSGLLPICAACKKIRDDKGYWNQIESYLLSHSEAEFTHGLCPACAEKLFDDLPSRVSAG
jgi:hypothetical protein